MDTEKDKKELLAKEEEEEDQEEVTAGGAEGEVLIRTQDHNDLG